MITEQTLPTGKKNKGYKTLRKKKDQEEGLRTKKGFKQERQTDDRRAIKYIG